MRSPNYGLNSTQRQRLLDPTVAAQLSKTEDNIDAFRAGLREIRDSDLAQRLFTIMADAQAEAADLPFGLEISGQGLGLHGLNSRRQSDYNFEACLQRAGSWAAVRLNPTFALDSVIEALLNVEAKWCQ